ncbi:MAG: sensor histidine kinase [Bacteroidia bacterium]
MSAQQKKILIHILGCITFLSLPILLARESETFFETINEAHTQKDFVAYLFMIGAFYANFFVFIPRFYRKNNLVFILSQLGTFLFIAFLLSFIHFGPPSPYQLHFPILRELKYRLFLYMVVVFVSLTLHVNRRWEIAEKEKVNAELSYLKAQINPHFLFNTLNSIYSLAIQKSDNAPDAIVKLSEMMRFILTDASHTFVNLKKELSQIDNYIELQKIRLGNTVEVNYSFKGNANDQQIAPMILIHFIENAFKYGVNPDERSKIEIAADLNSDKLEFKVTNKKVNVENKVSSPGTGIDNVRTRLQLLYPQRHQLVIKDTEQSFTVELKLDLS